MKILPDHPDRFVDDTILARYIRADPARIAVLNRILSLLDDDGRIGDDARLYIMKTALRRAVLRGVLIAEGIPLPRWAYETPEAAAANRQFAVDQRAKRRFLAAPSNPTPNSRTYQ